MEAVLFVAFISWMTPALVAAADGDKYDDSAFQYDYESLRIGGLVFAAVLFLLGVALIVSRKCACSKSGKSRSRDPNAESGVPREAIFPEQRDFEYGQLIPKFQRQRCLLQLCRTLCLCVKPRPANMQHASMFWLLNPRWMIPTNNT
ncbi:FXYD domain-containing ion transport regulator 6-like isoform X3 [Nerophis ophidion]|uniref:FXYD domain-containing ion transport regulator 6-like isoform X3 n=1 Tax=Nerophis ophidion TaxID=159077 RepID=UPI002ADFAAF8|nr:FXYD domain-containing ion transport regulator 6-like isoform X3 [Nerophis ophidion]